MQNQRRRRHSTQRQANARPKAPPVYALLAVVFVLLAILGTAWLVQSLTGDLLPGLIVGLLIAAALMLAWLKLPTTRSRS